MKNNPVNFLGIEMLGKINCRLCGGSAQSSFEQKILNKYQISYYLCDECGSLQTEKPFWLHEAYDPFNERFDTGQLIRSINNAAFLSAIVSYLQLENELLVDYGCGSGLLTRLLRDIGLNAWGFDSYSAPRLALGFQKASLDGAGIINLCEVAEHFENPAQSFDELFANKPELLIVQTGIFEKSDPNWFYLALDHGQHIFFYSHKSIEYLARRHNIAATFLDGFIVFFKLPYLEKLFNPNTSKINSNLQKLLANAVPNFLSKLLINGYKYAVNDNSLLKTGSP
ncbi:methyltransferase domain-containing protein [Polynucleobacter wuianus]|uniref:methyltransferase domain-containing protein n=1 Tax=Polynucleobacter wuianus TaxID=1743168 RepID=UPI001C0C6046|nr:methyltransferase domain-containing protein [Polynucleobacter wuianus]MBU3610056.1 methyltransferase domain-containing protein [Polynucleobacter wuianus]